MLLIEDHNRHHWLASTSARDPSASLFHPPIELYSMVPASRPGARREWLLLQRLYPMMCREFGFPFGSVDNVSCDGMTMSAEWSVACCWHSCPRRHEVASQSEGMNTSQDGINKTTKSATHIRHQCPSVIAIGQSDRWLSSFHHIAMKRRDHCSWRVGIRMSQEPPPPPPPWAWYEGRRTNRSAPGSISRSHSVVQTLFASSHPNHLTWGHLD